MARAAQCLQQNESPAATGTSTRPTLVALRRHLVSSWTNRHHSQVRQSICERSHMKNIAKAPLTSPIPNALPAGPDLVDVRRSRRVWIIPRKNVDDPICVLPKHTPGKHPSRRIAIARHGPVRNFPSLRSILGDGCSDSRIRIHRDPIHGSNNLSCFTTLSHRVTHALHSPSPSSTVLACFFRPSPKQSTTRT